MSDNREKSILPVENIEEDLKEPCNRKFFRTFLDEFVLPAKVENPDALPSRSNIRPEILYKHMSNMAVLDITDDTNPTYRLAGEEYCRVLGINPRNKGYLNFVPKRRQRSALAAYHACIENRCGMVTVLKGVSVSGRQTLCEIVNFPATESEGMGRVAYFYVSCIAVGDVEWIFEESSFRHYTEIVSRRFFDLGAGVPEHFAEIS